MNMQLSRSQLADVENITMTRHAKLMRWAEIIRKHPQPLFIFSGLEYCNNLDQVEHPSSAFALAAADPLLKDAGLTAPNVGAAKRFFELNHDDLHAFSCDCGGTISNETMARRITTIAGRST